MRYCHACGAQIPENSKFCAACGTQVVGVVSEKAPATQAPVVPSSPASPAPVPAAAASQKRHRGAIALTATAVIVALVAGSVAAGYFAWTASSVDPGAVQTIVIP